MATTLGFSLNRTKLLLLLALVAIAPGFNADATPFGSEGTHPPLNRRPSGTVVTLDLRGQQIACGYADIPSHVNRALFAEKACVHLGYAQAMGYRCGSVGHQEPSQAFVLTLDASSGQAVRLPILIEPGRQMGFYSELKCLTL